jgi:hypothetical protein
MQEKAARRRLYRPFGDYLTAARQAAALTASNIGCWHHGIVAPLYAGLDWPASRRASTATCSSCASRPSGLPHPGRMLARSLAISAARRMIDDSFIFALLRKIPMTHHAPPAEKLLTRQACRRPPDPDRQFPVAEVRSFQALDCLRVEGDKVALDLGAVSGLAAGVAGGPPWVMSFSFCVLCVDMVSIYQSREVSSEM